MLQLLRTSIRFIYRYIANDPVFVVLYGLHYFQKHDTTGALFYSKEEFFKQISEGKSIIRIGDGEIGLLHGRDIHYQKYDPELKKELKKIIAEYSDSSPYVLSIPIFVNYSNVELETTNGKKRCWLPLKVEFRRIFNRKSHYADAHFFYYKDLMHTFFDMFLKNKKVIFVSNKDANAKIQSSSFAFSSAHYINTPDAESFAAIESIQREIDAVLKNSDPKNVVLAISAGPASKVLVKRYADLGYQAFDVGFGLRYLYDEKDYSYTI